MSGYELQEEFEMVKLRLKRMGKKGAPFYRIVAADSHFPRDGRFIEAIGTYDPTRHPSAITLDAELAIKWLKNGAQPSCSRWMRFSRQRGLF